MHFDTKMNGGQKSKHVKNISAILNEDEENEVKVKGYRLVPWKWILTMIIMVCTAGLLWLLLYWVPK